MNVVKISNLILSESQVSATVNDNFTIVLGVVKKVFRFDLLVHSFTDGNCLETNINHAELLSSLDYMVQVKIK